MDSCQLPIWRNCWQFDEVLPDFANWMRRRRWYVSCCLLLITIHIIKDRSLCRISIHHNYDISATMFAIHNQQCLNIWNKNDIYMYCIFSENTNKMFLSDDKVVCNKIPVYRGWWLNCYSYTISLRDASIFLNLVKSSMSVNGLYL